MFCHLLLLLIASIPQYSCRTYDITILTCLCPKSCTLQQCVPTKLPLGRQKSHKSTLKQTFFP